MNASPILRDKYLRLIYKGRILGENSTLGQCFASSSTLNVEGNQEEEEAEGEIGSRPVYIHCAVSEAPVSSQVNK